MKHLTQSTIHSVAIIYYYFFLSLFRSFARSSFHSWYIHVKPSNLECIVMRNCNSNSIIKSKLPDETEKLNFQFGRKGEIATSNHQSNQNDAEEEKAISEKWKSTTSRMWRASWTKSMVRACQAKDIEQKWHTINVFCIIFGLPKNLFVEFPCWFVYLQVALEPDRNGRSNERKKEEKKQTKRKNKPYIQSVVLSHRFRKLNTT